MICATFIYGAIFSKSQQAEAGLAAQASDRGEQPDCGGMLGFGLDQPGMGSSVVSP
jgi:hypothetical protein